ncbi:MAG: response regulator [Kofleriaceae bacterium]|jgi:response regulator RpfG family c-di-GMP phosphodiesterase|nr:response regulator [Kofleriaceae bacterium]MBP6840137.1 response regulator [Kofleriaceae bacterium]MBP9207110.1 response regulator [Kofleriaceae bacterium]
MNDDAVEAPRILVVDDEKVIREILAEFLTLEGYAVATVEDGEKALTELRLRPYDLVITDLKMPRLSGLQLLAQIEAERIPVLVVIMTGFGTVETAIEAMKNGAYDYILKPFKVEEVIHVVQRGLYRQQLQTENIRLREALTIYKVSEAIATSKEIDAILDVILRAALDEAKADVAALHLRDPRTGRYEEWIKIGGDGGRTTVPTPEFALLSEQFVIGTPILAHGGKAHRFFRESRPGDDLVSYVAVPLQIGGTVIGALNAFSFTAGKKFDEGHRKMLSVLGSRAALAIDNARLYDDLRARNDQLETANHSLEEMFQHTVAGFGQALEESDLYTRGHSERVATYSEILARGLTLPDAEVQRIVQAGVMHDIGKIGIRYDMLNKPGKLTPEEVAVFRQHPEKGKRILDPVACLHGLIDGCWCHHEWFDGGGYPRGLSGQNIPLVGRIVAIADAYDAMTSDRAYRRALPHKVAVGEIERCAGTQFDPELADAFIRYLEAHRRREQEGGHAALLPR